MTSRGLSGMIHSPQVNNADPYPKKKVAEDFRESLSHPDKNKNDLKTFVHFILGIRRDCQRLRKIVTDCTMPDRVWIKFQDG